MKLLDIDFFQGLGFYEYLVLCEVLKAEPVWVINNGLSVTQEVPTSEIQPWVQVDNLLQSHQYLTLTDCRMHSIALNLPMDLQRGQCLEI